ncbi:signal peptidase I [Clostridium gelidum]|uniref:Signal peptidase I n=1 Tax=Clostridium gelidum TaxID=704125 RepID=A0ABM7T699_9CLOT|nr:signal peptidase I [Clostridium gelidum]BCZ46430.1 signal peptidase I [Clostridium gelidum]
MENNITCKPTSKKNIKIWIVVAVVVALGILCLISKSLLFNVYDVPGKSMATKINPGDKIVTTRINNTNNIERGNIIVFYSDEFKEELIKRVIGLPGDHIKIHDGIVNINGEDIKENYVINNESFNGVYDVPDNKYFFLADNRRISVDSRRWINPYIDGSNIQGKAIFRFSSFSSFGYL